MLSSSGAWDPYKGAHYCQSQMQVLFVDLAQRAYCSCELCAPCDRTLHKLPSKCEALHSQATRCADDADMDNEVALGSVRADASEFAAVDENPGGVFQGRPGHRPFAAKLRCCQWRETWQATVPAARRDLVRTQEDAALCGAQGR